MINFPNMPDFPVLSKEPYRRYLPSAYDDSLSIYEKLGHILEYLNSMGIRVNTLTQLVTLLGKDIRDFEENVNKEIERFENEMMEVLMPDSVEKVLTEWYENGKMEQIINDINKNAIAILNNVSKTPQGTKPPKLGIHNNTHKIVHKTSENELRIVQRTNQGYVKYLFEKNFGASGTGDYGVNHELIRIVGAYHVHSGYVYKDLANPKSGTITEYQKPDKYSAIEKLLYLTTNADENTSFGSKPNGLGMGVYSLKYGDSATYDMIATQSRKANVLLFTTGASSTKFQIKVNGQLVKEVNPRAFTFTGDRPNGLALIDFEIPFIGSSDVPVEVTFTNADVSGLNYIAALNFFNIDDYKGQDITDYKCIGSTRNAWISAKGASDYAFHDVEADKWYGSYHGGEKSEYDRLYWASKLPEEGDYYANYIPWANINVGDWRCQRKFNIFQQTDLADGKAKIVSNFDWNTDGTLEMEMGYYNGTVKCDTFYTALTSTDVNFNYLFYPVFHRLPDTPTGGFYNVPTTEGKISQVNSEFGLQLDIRFTKFNSLHDQRQATITDNKAYRKLYYGLVYGRPNATVVEQVSFSKGLDFIVR